MVNLYEAATKLRETRYTLNEIETLEGIRNYAPRERCIAENPDVVGDR